jgi:hypothetical protein
LEEFEDRGSGVRPEEIGYRRRVSTHSRISSVMLCSRMIAV